MKGKKKSFALTAILIAILGIWRGNPRPFNDRDESAACFFKA